MMAQPDLKGWAANDDGTLKPGRFQAIGDLVPSIEWLGIVSTAPDEISAVDHVKC